MYDRERGEYRNQAPSDTAVRNEYYTLVGPKGEKSVAVEKWLAQLEGKTKPVIDALASGERIDKAGREILATFLALLITRTPEFRQTNQELMEHLVRSINKFAMGTKEGAEATIERMRRDTGKDVHIPPEKLVEYVANDRYGVKVEDWAQIKLMLSLSEDLAHLFASMNWLVLFAPGRYSFVTSDNPVVKIPPPDYMPGSLRGVGFGTPGALKVVSLSHSTCLLIGDPGDLLQFREARQVEVRWFNLIIASHVNEYLIGRDKALVVSIAKKARLTVAKRGKRIQT